MSHNELQLTFAYQTSPLTNWLTLSYNFPLVLALSWLTFAFELAYPIGFKTGLPFLIWSGLPLFSLPYLIKTGLPIHGLPLLSLTYCFF